MDFSPFERDGLVHSGDVACAGIVNRELTNAVARGLLVRLRQATYVRRDRWQNSSAAERHLLRIRAAATAATHALIFARESAGALWGVPLPQFPEDVVVLEEWKGGGRSEPGVRRTARGASTAATITRHGFRMTTLPRTLLDIARVLPFQQVVPIFDWAMSASRTKAVSVTKPQLIREGEMMRCSSANWQAIEFASSDSGSWGESDCRAAIHLLGYPAPELQRRFVDSEGEMFVDFYFDRDDVACEFDGKSKYTHDKYTMGDPAEVVWREKKREDRLRKQVRTVVRILTEDVRNPHLLDRKLREAGVRRHGPAGGLG